MTDRGEPSVDAESLAEFSRLFENMAEPDVVATPTMPEAAAQVVEHLLAFAEAAYGYKIKLDQMGWSPTVAEQAAGSALLHLQSMVLGQAG